ncbi:hypothetical protein GTQ43_37875 [Nostoc sp. KVJ3]|uniref:metallophosphoesterase n=1 Tax=Nostoc sp. KVJ3 TaxID=457945 RepID=UPI0022373FDB|nr:metallophosphoesterase [Nostoc sp. KVJ3]MCW5319166.1 hypothetical protein [Nostoc sp. KVJ3]
MSKWLTQIGAHSIDFSYLNKSILYKIYQRGQINFDSTKLYLLLGDIHGNIKAAIILAIRLQTLFSIPLCAIFQVGDFGFWPSGIAAKNEDPYYKKDDSFDLFEMNQSLEHSQFFSVGAEKLEIMNAPFYFSRGNHEDFEQLNLISKDKLTEVFRGIYFIPDYFKGMLEGLNVLVVGGILTDLKRGKGNKAKLEFKKAQQKLKTDIRRSNAQLLIQFDSTGVDLLITHSGLSSREHRDGSKQLETYLLHSNICLHFYGHHHRFSLGNVGANTLSIGLRNLDIDAKGMLRPGSFALIAWNDQSNFEIYSDFAVIA